MELISGILIYPASQPQRLTDVQTALTDWQARSQQLDAAPTVNAIPAGKYSPTNPAMAVLLWFGEDTVTDRAEADAAWARIQSLNLNWVQPGSWIRQSEDIDGGHITINERLF